MLHAGDVVCTRGSGFVSKAIRFFTRTIGESRTRVNHTAIVTHGGGLKYARIAEALSRVRWHGLWWKYAHTGTKLWIFRHRGLSDDDKTTLTNTALSMVGRKYGYLKIAAHVADYLLLGAYVFRRLARMKNYPICSYLDGYCFFKIGVELGGHYTEISPDHIYDHCTKSDDWFLVYEGELP